MIDFSDLTSTEYTLEYGDTDLLLSMEGFKILDDWVYFFGGNERHLAIGKILTTDTDNLVMQWI